MRKNKKGRTHVQSDNAKKQNNSAQIEENADVLNNGSVEKPQKAGTDIEIDVKIQQEKAAVPEQEVSIKMETEVPNQETGVTEEKAAAHHGKFTSVRFFTKFNKKSGTIPKDTRVDTVEVLKSAAFDYNIETEQPDIGLLQNAKEHVLSVNPVFVKAIALVPILGAATSLKSGVMLSGAMFLTVVLLNLVMYPLYRIIPRGYRFAASFVAAGAVITPIYMLSNYLAPTVAMLCSIYLPLIAVCAVPMIEKKHYGQKFGIAKTMLDAALDGVGFAFAAILFSIIREIAGSGKLYDRPLPYGSEMKFSFAQLPAGAFLLLALLVALFRKIYGTNNDGGGKTK